MDSADFTTESATINAPKPIPSVTNGNQDPIVLTWIAYKEYVKIPPCTIVEADTKISENGTRKEKTLDNLLLFVPENFDKIKTEIM
jgi:hypothetical protein